MAITKNKIELLDRTISLRLAIDEYYDDGYDYYDYDDYYGCSCPSCLGYDDSVWIYIEPEECRLIYKFKRGRVISFGKSPKIGSMIDMRSVYSKDILRQKNIDSILGLSNEFQKLKISDIWKK
jgi:hypothetical protein